MFCSKCGKQVLDDAQYCSGCGNLLHSSSQNKKTKDYVDLGLFDSELGGAIRNIHSYFSIVGWGTKKIFKIYEKDSKAFAENMLLLCGCLMGGTVLFSLLGKFGVNVYITAVIYAVLIRLCQNYLRNKTIQKYEQSVYFKATKVPYEILNDDKGRQGEFAVCNSLSKFEQNGAKLLFNINIPKYEENEKTTEIDGLMIHRKGLFVFESKNYTGTIIGEDEDHRWKQVYYYRDSGNVKQINEFYNPIKQNKGHVFHLNKFVGRSNTYPISVVVFSDECDCRQVIGYRNNVLITTYSSLKSQMDQLMNTLPDVYDDEEIKTIYEKLQPLVSPPPVIAPVPNNNKLGILCLVFLMYLLYFRRC